jgi:hypothetical protein
MRAAAISHQWALNYGNIALMGVVVVLFVLPF